MIFRLVADGVLALHLAFVLFVLLGGILAIWWRWFPFVHLPAAAWGVWIEISGGVCPLTHLENALRIRAGQAGYAESFVAYYLLAIIYPSGLTREIQFVLAGVVVGVNLAIYGWVFLRKKRR